MHRKSAVQIQQVVGAVKGDAPTIEVKHYALAGSGLARIIARVVHTAASRANPQLVSQAIRNKFGNQMHAVAGSIKVIDKGPVSDDISAIVSVVRESQAIASNDDLKGFKAIASNMFLDDEDKMWTLNKTESGSILVRTTGIDDDNSLLSMLHATASSVYSGAEGQRLEAIASSIRSRLEGGQFVSYVNSNDQVATGFIVAIASTDEAGEMLVMLPGEKAEAEMVNPAAVTEIHDTSEVVAPELSEQEQVNTVVAAQRDAITIEMLLDYYRKVFGYNPEYFEKFAALVRERAYA